MRPDLFVATEIRFYPGRKWRLDLLVWASDVPLDKVPVAVEIRGDAWAGNFEKHAAFAERRYRFLAVTPQDIRTDVAVKRISACFWREASVLKG